MGFEIVNYGEFSAELHETLDTQGRFPSNATLEITRRCPLTCAHCYNNLPMGDTEARRAEMSYDEYCRILDELHAAGTLWLLFTGGEVFARKDFLDIYTYAKKKGFIITIFTNGILITPEIADYLAQWRPFAIEITLYGRTRETYEALTGVTGSYDKCMRGIELLLERKLPLALKSVGVTINQHEIGAMKEFAQELGIGFKFDTMMSPRIDCSQSPLAVRLTAEESVALDLQDEARVAGWREFANYFASPVHEGEINKGVYHCGGGVMDCAIDPQGRLSICVLSHYDQYDLRHGNFREGWDVFLKAVRLKPQTMVTKCLECSIKAMCGMCPANGELENGDPEKPVDYLCHVAHLRAYTLGINVPAHGDCEYCAGGVAYDSLQESVQRLNKRAEVGVTSSRSSKYLPVLSSSATGQSMGGCGSCSAF